MAGGIAFKRTGRTNSADLPIRHPKDTEGAISKLRRGYKALNDTIDTVGQAVKTYTGGDYYDRTRKRATDAIAKHFPKTEHALRTITDLIAQGAAIDNTATLPYAGMQLGIFIGPKAVNFDHPLAAKAYEALRKGASPEQVWHDYGIAFDSAGIPRQWVHSPEDFSLTKAGEQYARGRALDPRYRGDPAETIIHAPVTYENYPQMRQWNAKVSEGIGKDFFGNFDDAMGVGTPQLMAHGPRKLVLDNPDYPFGINQRRVLAHEMGGHGISTIEGSSRGGTPDFIPTQVRQAYPHDSNYDLYRRAGDEQWANMQALRNELPEAGQRDISPYWHFSDVHNQPYHEQAMREAQWSQQYDPTTGKFTFKQAFDPAKMKSPADRPDLMPAPIPRGKKPAYRPKSKSSQMMAGGGPSDASGVASAEVPATPVPGMTKGRSGAISGLKRLGDYPTTDPAYIAAQTKANEGNSVNVLTGIEPQDGLLVGSYRNTDPRNLVVTGDMTPGDAERFFQKNKKVLNQPDKYFGTWTSGGKTYLDVSKRFDPKDIRKATKFGERTAQISGFDRGNFAEFPIGNWRDFVRSDEFAQRMAEMNQKGAEHLAQHPNKDWWNMRGTDMEGTYGTERLPQVAGSVAATAPTQNPRQNLMIASEYMRRHIKGEPLYQPNWRIGDSGGDPAFFQPGGKLPMQEAQIGNVRRGISGLPLGGPKVESERLALLGDPNAVVLDRWWARLGENPDKGVFTNAKEGVISPEDYPIMQEAVRQAAPAHGLTPNTFSSNVWTGTREQAKTGKLYGQKTKASAITGDSKSYPDHFTDLVNEKAARLGIPPEVMKARIGAGDANLLSYLAATAGGLAILNAMGYGQNQQEPVL